MYDVRESCLIIESNLFDCKEMGFLVFKEHMIPLDWYFMKWLDVIYRLYLKTFNIWLKSCYIFNKTESYIFSSLNHIILSLNLKTVVKACLTIWQLWRMWCWRVQDSSRTKVSREKLIWHELKLVKLSYQSHLKCLPNERCR